MKMLLDECVPKQLKNHFKDWDTSTVVEQGWSGVKNGNLMKLCVDNQFDILLTIDKNMMYQQNLEKYPVIVVVFNSGTSRIEELLGFIPPFLEQVESFEKRHTYIISDKNYNN